IIAMKKEQEASLMHDHRFGKGERHAHKTSETLPQGVLPPLDMGGFSRLFSHGGMLLLWNGLPQPLTRLFTPITHCIGHHLAALSAESNPHPGVVGFFEHKRAIRLSSSSVVDVGSSGSGA